MHQLLDLIHQMGDLIYQLVDLIHQLGDLYRTQKVDQNYQIRSYLPFYDYHCHCVLNPAIGGSDLAIWQLADLMPFGWIKWELAIYALRVQNVYSLVKYFFVSP